MFLSEQTKLLTPYEFNQKFVQYDKEIQSFIHVLRAQLECIECYIYNELTIAVNKETYSMLKNALPEDVIDFISLANDFYIVKFHDDCQDIYEELSSNLYKMPTISIGEGLVTIWQAISSQPYQILRQSLLTLDSRKIIEWNQLKNTFIVRLNKNVFSIYRDCFEHSLNDFLDGIFINLYDDYKNEYNTYSALLDKVDWCVHRVGNTNPSIFMCVKNSTAWNQNENEYTIDINQL